MKGLHHHENYPKLKKLGSSESFKVQIFSDRTIFPQGCCQKLQFFFLQNVCPLCEHFHISHEN